MKRPHEHTFTSNKLKVARWKITDNIYFMAHVVSMTKLENRSRHMHLTFYQFSFNKAASEIFQSEKKNCI